MDAKDRDELADILAEFKYTFEGKSYYHNQLWAWVMRVLPILRKLKGELDANAR